MFLFQVQERMDQKNSEYKPFSRSESFGLQILSFFDKIINGYKLFTIFNVCSILDV